MILTLAFSAEEAQSNQEQADPYGLAAGSRYSTNGTRVGMASTSVAVLRSLDCWDAHFHHNFNAGDSPKLVRRNNTRSVGLLR